MSLSPETMRALILHTGRELWLARAAWINCADEIGRVQRHSPRTIKNRTAAFRRLIPELPALLAARKQRHDRLAGWSRELGNLPGVDSPSYRWQKKQRHTSHSRDLCRACYWWHIAGTCVVPPKRYRRTVVGSVRLYVFDRDEYRCRYCGTYPNRQAARFDTDRLTIDHVISWLDHPSGDPWDLVAACLPCNIRKGTATGVPIPRTHEALQSIFTGPEVVPPRSTTNG